MALLFHIPGEVPLYSGEPQPSSTLTFTLTGTSTPSDVYTDDELSVAHDNPVTADSAGYFAPIYINPSVSLKCVWKNSGGSTLKTWDIANDVFETTGTFTGSLTGCTTVPTGTLRWVKYGKAVTLYIPAISATSNTTACTITGAPSSIFPTRSQVQSMRVTDNGSTTLQLIQVETSGVLTLFQGGSATGFTGSGTKGVALFTIHYSLD